MSVMMELRAHGDVDRLRNVMQGTPERWQRINDMARQNGCIHHQFLTDGEGTVLVLDEWANREGFEKFFAGNADVQAMMAEAGVVDQPEVSFWEPMDTPDKF